MREFEPGTPLLSRALPVRSEPYDPEQTRPYIEGLLPAGLRRRRIAEELGIGPEDDYGLIAALGRDCPGAVTFLPAGSEPQGAEPDLDWLEEDELAELLAAEPERLVDPEDERWMRFALPGERHKLALLHDEAEDRWAWPTPQAPSTHVVKPEGEGRETHAANELACSLALRGMGFAVVHAEARTIAGRRCLISKRFDRWQDSRRTARLHQESFAQATGCAAAELADRHEARSCQEAAELLREVGESAGVEALLVAAYAAFLLGDRGFRPEQDLALLHTEAGPLLAPLHGIASQALDEDPTEPRPAAEAVRRNFAIAGLIPIGIGCGYEPQPALELGIQTIGRLIEALGAVAERAYEEEDWYDPLIDEILQRVIARYKSFGEEIELLGPED